MISNNVKEERCTGSKKTWFLAAAFLWVVLVLAAYYYHNYFADARNLKILSAIAENVLGFLSLKP